MKKHWGVVLVFSIALCAAGQTNPYFGKYKTAYDGRMDKAETEKEISFLTTRYDEALEKIHTQLLKSGKTEEAVAVWAERERIRSLEKVADANVFKNPLPAAVSGNEQENGGSEAIVDCFGIERSCSRPVFLLHAGPAIVHDRENPMQGRIRFDVLRRRLMDTINKLPAGTEFNAALFWAPIIAPFSVRPVESSLESKELFDDWISPVNALDSSMCFGQFPGPVHSAVSRLSWPERLETPKVESNPKWIYSYKVSNALMSMGQGRSRPYIHWAGALCFAFEQKADAVFIISSNLIVNRDEDMHDLSEMLGEIMEALYGKDRKAQPTVNFIMVAREGRKSEVATLPKIALKTFNGEVVVIDDVEEWMTKAEEKKYDSL